MDEENNTNNNDINVHDVLTAMGLPKTFAVAERRTRIGDGDNEWLPVDWYNDHPLNEGYSFWKLAHRIQHDKSKNQIIWTTKTVENGHQCGNSVLTFDAMSGMYVSGRLNCFSLGWKKLPRNDGYIGEFLQEVTENGAVQWDKVEL
jgi:hypothetical protein